MNRTAVLIVGLAALVSFALYDTYSRGVAVGRSEVAARQVAIYQRVVRQTDSVYRADTIRLRLWRDRWDTVRIIDTVIIDNIVYVPRTVADSVVTACYAVLRSCEQRVAARDSVIRGLQGVITAKDAATPSVVRLWIERGLWMAAGVGVGSVIK